MTQAKTINSVSIIHQYTENKLSARPEYYSGRGATHSDLNSDILEMLYGGIKTEAGDEAAKEFAQFVYDFESLSATAFLIGFRAFCANGCKCPPKTKKKPNVMDGIEVAKDANGDYDVNHGMMSIGAALGSHGDDTEVIRYQFVRRHEGEIKVDPKRKNRDVFMVGYRRY